MSSRLAEVGAAVRRLAAKIARDEDRHEILLSRQLAAIVESSNVAIVGGTLDGIITSWNRAAAELFGYTAEEIIGQPGAVLAPDDRREEQQDLREQLRDGTSVTLETVRRHRDGTHIDVEATLSPVRDASGTVSAASAVYRDIRQRRTLERRVERGEQRLRTFGELADGIVYWTVLSPEPHVAYVGPAIEPITGFTPEQFYADPELPVRRTHPEDRHLAQRPREGSSDVDETGRVTYRFQHADGHWLWLEDHFRFERDTHSGRVRAVQGIVFDVSARQEAEHARQQALEHEQRTRERLEATVQMQRTFVQAVSHELRTPLTSIIGFARTLNRFQGRLEPDRVRFLLGRLEHNADRLGRLLADLLDVDRLSRGAIEPDRSPVDLGQLCRAVAEEIAPAGHRIELELEGAPTIVADGPKLERIVDNLLRNAVKHTPAGTGICLWFTEERSGVVLTVEDDGPGIPQAVADEMFEPFRQGPDAALSASPGTGVGLAIVAQFARLHGGEAWYEPRPGGGSRFRVRLPRAPNLPNDTEREGSLPRPDGTERPEAGY